MKLAVLIRKGCGDPGLGAAEALSLATDEGSRSIGLGERIGRLAPGYRADVTLLDPRRLPMAPQPPLGLERRLGRRSVMRAQRGRERARGRGR